MRIIDVCEQDPLKSGQKLKEKLFFFFCFFLEWIAKLIEISFKNSFKKIRFLVLRLELRLEL